MIYKDNYDYTKKWVHNEWPKERGPDISDSEYEEITKLVEEIRHGNEKIDWVNRINQNTGTVQVTTNEDYDEERDEVEPDETVGPLLAEIFNSDI